MKKIIYALCISTLIMSCSESIPTIKPETVEIKGALKGCYEVVDKDYVIKENGSWGSLVSIELKRTNNDLPFDSQKTTSFSVKEDGKPTQAGFGIEFLDKNGDIVEVKNANQGGLGGVYSSNDIDAAFQLNSGETGIVRWSVNIENNPVSFRITSAVEGSGRTNNKSSQKSSSWTAVLDEYEKFIDSYIVLLKKVANNDMNAIMESATILEKAESLGEKLNNAENSLSSAELSRFMKLQQKIASAAMNM